MPDHYPAVGECLLGALSRYATSSWDAEAEAAWVRAYTAISQIMIDAAAENEAVAPAWWQAEVVSHELRTPEIAVVTVRPDQPYPFRAGQYTSVETPWWPRIWRHYSFASAPRSDGLLSFHVKAVPAGWVSNAMVHRARPGDVIRLGAPGGSMTVDHSTSNGLLCVGGGTGIAPIKALIEDVAEHGTRRPVEVFYGARSDHDLYDIDTMLRLEQTHPWLSVRPVVASGSGPRRDEQRQRPTPGRGTPIRAVAGVRRLPLRAARADPQRRGRVGGGRHPDRLAYGMTPSKSWSRQGIEVLAAQGELRSDRGRAGHAAGRAARERRRALGAAEARYDRARRPLLR